MLDYYVPNVPMWWKYGRPAELWYQHHELIEELVARHNLKEVPAAQLPVQGLTSAATQQSEVMALRPPIVYGGMRVPHLHLGDKVYRLSSEQWKEFSTGVVKSFATKLADSKAVSLTRLLELSSVIDSMS
jgi:hypothetical protein